MSQTPTGQTAIAAPARAVTLKDVAARAGVNKSSVSVVLNGAKSSGGVSAEARERILAAAAELDYRPHAIGRALSQRRTNLFGFYSSFGHVNARNPFFAEIIGGMQDGCEVSEQQLVLYTQGRERAPEEIFNALTNGTIDGLVLFSAADAPLVERLAQARLPVVALADAVQSLPSVVVDDAQGGRLLADHLAERGHRRVLYRKRSELQESSERRLAGFRDRARAHRITVTECWTSRTSAITEEEKALLNAPLRERPTAIVGWSDYSAYRMLAECDALGLRVPQDVAIVGFDGHEYDIAPARTMTTIRAPWGECAQAAISVLIQRIEGLEVPRETVLPVALVQGDTT